MFRERRFGLVSGSGLVEQARAAFFLEPKALMFATL